MESHYVIHKLAKDEEPLIFSEQQLVDCAGDFANNGCKGGLPGQAFEYIHHNGLALGKDYAYTAMDEECKYNKDEMMVGEVRFGSYNITEGDEIELINSILHVGPVSMAFQVLPDFRFYKEGIYRSD